MSEDRKFFILSRRKLREKSKQRPKSIHKAWVDIPSGVRALLCDGWIVLQLGTLAFLYAFFAYVFPVFWYISLGLTVLAAAHVFICERDPQSKSSWLFLFIVSFGCGYIVYFLADKRICYGHDKRRFEAIFNRSLPFVVPYDPSPCSAPVANDCEYLYNAGGFVPYKNTDIRYYSSARELFDNMIGRLEEAQKFIFIEYFIVADGILLERLIDVLSRKIAQGVDVRLLYDDVGSQGVFSGGNKKRLKAAGVKLRTFEKLFQMFSFSLNYRDHRKIVVIDGKTGYVGGCNIADECVNQHRMQGRWKDAGLRLDGAAVDGLSLMFMRQWEFATREQLNFPEYLNKFEPTENTSNIVPYAGGPELSEPLCRGVYANLIAAARQKLYIMSPYLIPDGDLFAQIKSKAQSGVDVRIVLPAVPDYPFIYRVTRSNAERLMASGVKIYYVNGAFVHSKVMLTENAVAVGSVNVDMRAFYLEYDNGVYTDDRGVMEGAQADFESVFTANEVQSPARHNIFSRFITAVLRMVSPLM